MVVDTETASFLIIPNMYVKSYPKNGKTLPGLDAVDKSSLTSSLELFYVTKYYVGS